METVIYLPKEDDVKQWIKDAIREFFNEQQPKSSSSAENSAEELISRKEVAEKLGISLVTLTDWVKRGLPQHKNRGRVYFLWSEVVEYLIQRDQEKK